MKTFVMLALIGSQIGYTTGALVDFIKGNSVVIDGTFLVIPLIFTLCFLKEEVVGLLKL